MKQKNGKLLSNFAFKSNLRRYTLVGYAPRADLWKMCYSIAHHDATSQTFHKQCDTLVGRCRRCRLNPGGAG